MYSNNKLTKAVRLALAFGAASAFVGSAVAQETAQNTEEEKVERIEITGSRIQSANMISASPVTTVSSEEFQFAGATRVEDLLVTLPQLSPGFDSFTVNPTTGYATADLRGLGSQRTLVLVNGHRLQPGGIRSEARDLNQIPAALVKRVEVLTGGASAVYGSDAVAGVVNFILDTDFEGVSLNLGTSGYQHKNRNSYIAGLMDARGFDYPTGNSGIDGKSNNVDLALGGSFDGGKGHAMAYITWRRNDELRQGARDYSSCALNNAGNACGGSSTSPIPSFLGSFGLVDAQGNPIQSYGQDDDGNWVLNPAQVRENNSFFNLNPSNVWQNGTAPLYNYAPINHYQRPDTRYTFGTSIKYEVNEHFEPYLEAMGSSNRTAVQIAESGTFFVNTLTLNCNDARLGSFCSDLNNRTVRIRNEAGEQVTVPAFIDPNVPVSIRVGKRNNEGGPRISEIESNSFRLVTGAKGFINDDWSYNVSYLYGRNSSSEINQNDFLANRTGEALLLCPPGSSSTCVPYNVWEFGGVTPDAARGLGGVGIRAGATDLKVLTGYVTGSMDNFIPGVTSPISSVFGVEYRKETYQVRVDSNMATGNFTGLGGPRSPIDGGFSVREAFFEGYVPVFEGDGLVQDVTLELGYRLSDYSTSGTVESYKVGFTSQVSDMVRVRGGYNRAIRGPSISELFSEQSIGLWGGEDRCAGEEPQFSEAQCGNTGMTSGQYGSVSASPASQYNQFSGGNPNLKPETADTYTIGFAATPFDRFDISVDYYAVELTDRIGSIGSQTILNFCATTGDPFLCNKVNRSAGGDLWVGSDLASSGFIENLNSNFGDLTRSGIDINASYHHNLGDGRMHYSFNGGYNLKYEIAPLPGVNDNATYDCAGTINVSCQLPKWRHSARAAYSFSDYTVSLRWRYNGEMDYKNTDGTKATTDGLLAPKGKLEAWNYFDLSASAQVTEALSFTAGVNNVFDKAPPIVGATLSLNANSPGGYDQLGRYFFATASLRF